MAQQLYKLTADELATFPSDGKRYEIVEGELHVSPSPGRRHQTVVRALFRLLDGHALRTVSGETFMAPDDVRLSDADVVQPDVLFIRRERSQIYREQAVEGAPDLVIEVLSPSTR